MTLPLEPGEYVIQVRNQNDELLHVVSVHALATVDPTERILAAARGAVGYAERMWPDHFVKYVLFIEEHSGRTVHRWNLDEEPQAS